MHLDLVYMCWHWGILRGNHRGIMGHLGKGHSCRAALKLGEPAVGNETCVDREGPMLCVRKALAKEHLQLTE